MIEEGAASKKHNAKVITLKGMLILASRGIQERPEGRRKHVWLVAVRFIVLRARTHKREQTGMECRG